MKKQFRLVWEIDVEADSEVEAMHEALTIMQDKGSAATIFSVQSVERGSVAGNGLCGIPKIMDAADYEECAVCAKMTCFGYDNDYVKGYLCDKCGEVTCEKCLDDGNCRTCSNTILRY